MSKIGNPVVEVPTGIELNEKDYCACLLTTLKDLVKNYVVAMTEASNPWLYDHYKDSFLELSQLQRDLFDLMFQNGWYQLESVDSKKITDKYNTLNKDYKGLSE